MVLDSTSVLILRAVTSAEALMAVSLNSIVILMVVAHSPEEFKHFAFLILCSSIAQILTSLGAWMTVSQVVGTTADGTAAIAVYGLAALFGPKMAFLVDSFTFITGVVVLWIPPFSMGYRIYLLHLNSLKRRYLFLALLFILSPFIWMQTYKCQQFFSPEELFTQLPDLESKLEGYPVFGMKNPVYRWETTALIYLRYEPLSTCLVTLLLRQILFWDIRRIRRRSHEIETNTAPMQKETVWIMTIQGAIPLILALSTTFSVYSLKDNTVSLLNSLTFVISAVQYICDPVTVLLCLPIYRTVIHGWICRLSRRKMTNASNRVSDTSTV